MWWKALGLGVAVAMLASAQQMTIDKNLNPNNPDTNVELETPVVSSPPLQQPPGNVTEPTLEPGDTTHVEERNGEDIPEHMSEEQSLERGAVVETELGEVQGFFMHAGIRIVSFIDIPYGAIRGIFTAPVPPRPWEGIHEVSEHTSHCPQLQDDGTYTGGFDCLTLSVFAPENAENAKVLFHIHDGNFVSGSGDPSIYGPEHLVSKDIILVLPNYRLGAFGFLCLRNEIAPGNAALKDLTLALNWTKHNIEGFGGDPSSITVSGEGSSGALVGYLALSPKSKHYITRAITESGSVLAHWAIDRDLTTTSAHLIEVVNAVETQSANTINRTDMHKIARAVTNSVFKPCIENASDPDAFITESPWTILQDNTTEINIDFMIGSADHAGLHEAMDAAAHSLLQLNEDFSTILPNDLRFDNKADKDEISDQVKRHYFETHDVSLQNLDQLSLCYTDAWYLWPVLRLARPLLDLGVKVYLYEFSFLGEFNREHLVLESTVEGAARGDLVGYVFAQDEILPAPGTAEERLVNLMTDLWVSFIKTGTPTSEDEEFQWQELQNVVDSQEQWLSIGAVVTSQTGLYVERMRLWSEIYARYFVERNSARALLTLSYSLLAAAIFLAVSRSF